MPYKLDLTWNLSEQTLPYMEESEQFIGHVSSEEVLTMNDAGEVRILVRTRWDDSDEDKWHTTCSEGWQVQEPKYWAYIPRPNFSKD